MSLLKNSTTLQRMPSSENIREDSKLPRNSSANMMYFDILRAILRNRRRTDAFNDLQFQKTQSLKANKPVSHRHSVPLHVTYVYNSRNLVSLYLGSRSK